jgi:hypothetical protein
MRFAILLLSVIYFAGCAKKSTVDAQPKLTLSTINLTQLDLSDSSIQERLISFGFGYQVQILKKLKDRLIIKKIEFIDQGKLKLNYLNDQLPPIAENINILDAENGNLLIEINSSVFKDAMSLGDTVLWQAKITDYMDRESIPIPLTPIVRVK